VQPTLRLHAAGSKPPPPWRCHARSLADRGHLAALRSVLCCVAPRHITGYLRRHGQPFRHACTWWFTIYIGLGKLPRNAKQRSQICREGPDEPPAWYTRILIPSFLFFFCFCSSSPTVC
jgi:hypothetical protein